MESWSLLELNQRIQLNLKEAMPQFYWVVAEINEMHVNGAGHCFLELIEKAPNSEQITAKAKANIWAYHFRMLRPYFETMTGQRIVAGLKVMLQVSVEFHELYGMSLQVADVNPAFTVGDLALQKQAVIRKLTDEGVIDMNRELELELVPQRIAVISSETAAGYGDFTDQLHHNPSGYIFRHTLFQAVLQGNEAETSIIRALEQIFDREEEFDVVVIIRGGGSQSDLNCFNSYRLACCIAQFPLPIITGIGHDRDDTIADQVACIPLKTPTAVAEYLISRVASFDRSLQELTQRLADTVTYSLEAPAEMLQQQSHRLQNILRSHLHKQDKDLQAIRFRLLHAVSALLSQKRFEQAHLLTSTKIAGMKAIRIHCTKTAELRQRTNKTSRIMLSGKQEQISWLNNKLRLLDPFSLLQRGYSITFSEGKIIRSIHDLKKGQHIETILNDGKVDSIVANFSNK